MTVGVTGSVQCGDRERSGVHLASVYLQMTKF